MKKVLFSLLVIIIGSEFNAMAQDTLGDNLFSRYGIDNIQKPIHDRDPKTITNPLELYEDSLVYFIDSLTYTSDEKARDAGNSYFIKIMRGMLKTPNSYNYPFKELSKSMNIIVSPDDAFKIYNWQMQLADGTTRYYGVMQMKSGKINPLIDVSSSILRGAEDSVFHNMKWYGALYYQIIPKEINGSKKYFVLGFNSASPLNNKKIVECFQFIDDRLVLGGPYFEFFHKDKANANRAANRFIIEYQKDAKVQLGWDANLGMLVYDHLESTIGDPSKKSTYAPDGTYDGLKWVGNGWRVIQNVIKLVPQSESSIPVNENAPKKVLQPDRE